MKAKDNCSVFSLAKVLVGEADFIPTLDKMVTEGMITIEKVNILGSVERHEEFAHVIADFTQDLFARLSPGGGDAADDG